MIPSEVTETVGNCTIKFLEHVQVRVNLVFERRGDLYLELIAPSGTISPLTRQRRVDSISGRQKPDKLVYHYFIQLGRKS